MLRVLSKFLQHYKAPDSYTPQSKGSFHLCQSTAPQSHQSLSEITHYFPKLPSITTKPIIENTKYHRFPFCLWNYLEACTLSVKAFDVVRVAITDLLVEQLVLGLLLPHVEQTRAFDFTGFEGKLTIFSRKVGNFLPENTRIQTLRGKINTLMSIIKE